jgi:SNF2 family DNA or RNA helicase
MTVAPHSWQLKAAAQMDWLCRSRFRGAIVGDPPGLGKTLEAVLAMHLCKDEPGICLVVCPKSLCDQWRDTIECSWEEVSNRHRRFST